MITQPTIQRRCKICYPLLAGIHRRHRTAGLISPHGVEHQKHPVWENLTRCGRDLTEQWWRP